MLDVKEGKWLSVVYFEYFENLTPISKTNLVQNLLNFQYLTRNYREKSCSDVICDYTKDDIYISGKKKLLSIFYRNNMSHNHILIIESFISEKNCTYNVAHGDFRLGNVFHPDIIIDFDRAGYYPIAYDLSISITIKYKIFKDYFEIENYIKLLQPKLTYIDRVLTMYFAVVFHCHFVNIDEINDKYIIEYFENIYKQFEDITN